MYFNIIKKIAPILCFCIIIVSCEKEVNVDIPEHQPRLVAHCLFDDSGNWLVKLSLTKSIFDTLEAKYINDAVVELYENNSLKEVLTNRQNGIYRITSEAGFFPRAGNEYMLKVKHDLYPDIDAQEIFSDKPEILDCYLDASQRVVRNNIYGYNLILTINNLSLESEYYFVKLTRDIVPQSNFEYNGLIYLAGDTIYDQIVHFHIPESVDLHRCHLTNWFFHDDFFNGTSYTIEILIDENYLFETVKLDVGVYKINEILYKYGINYANFYDAEGLIGFAGQTLGFTNPSETITNCNGGYGIFAGLSGYNYQIELNQY